MKEFFRRYYTPNNLSLVIAGDFDPAEAKRLVEKYFGGLPPGPALDRPRRWIPQLDGERVVEVSDRVPAARTYVAFVAPEYFGADEAAMQIAARILGDGLSSRLEQGAGLRQAARERGQRRLRRRRRSPATSSSTPPRARASRSRTSSR